MTRAAWLIALASLALCGACTVYQKDIGYRPPLSGLPGSATDAETSSTPGHTDPMQLPTTELVVENEDGTRTLIIRNGRHLARHIMWALEEDERELFVEQVLSTATRQEFVANGRDPTDAFDMVRKHRRDLALLFARMPMGEHSPSVLMSKVGKRIYRVKLTGPAARDLHYAGYDMILEGGNWRLLWFVR